MKDGYPLNASEMPNKRLRKFKVEKVKMIIDPPKTVGGVAPTKYPLIASMDEKTDGRNHFNSLLRHMSGDNEQEGQVALNRSPELCLKLTYRYLLKADHVPCDTWGGAIFGPSGII